MNGTESKILQKIAELNLATKTELKNSLSDNGNSDISSVIDTATGNLIEKGMITTIAPIGSTCYIITKKGSKFLQEIKQ